MTKEHGKTARQPDVTPMALTVAQVAKVLSAAGGRMVSEDMIRADLDAGAPVNGDGTINLIHFTAWLAKAASGGGNKNASGPGRGEAGGD